MKNFLIAAAVIASVIATPTIAFAQTDTSLTRADVKAQLIQLEQAGYKPTSDRNTYPRDLQAAETHVSAQIATDVSYGPSCEVTSASGAGAVPMSAENSRSVYTHH